MSHQLKLQQLKYFIAVAEELSFRRAAERLFITQPPLSRQIKALEATLGARLLERDRQGVRLTEAGGSFLANARSVVRESEQLVLKFNRQRDHIKSTVTLGITTVVDVSLFAWVDAAFEARVPGVRVSVKRQTSAQSIRELHQGAIDVAVIGLPSRAEGLTIEHLCDDPMAACIASTHPLAQKRRVSIVDLQHDNLFWFARKLNPAYYDYCQRVFERVGFNPRRLAEPTDHHVLLGLIALGQGIALVPKSLGSVTRKGVVFKEMVEGDQLCIRAVAAFQGDGFRAGVGPGCDAQRKVLGVGAGTDAWGQPRGVALACMNQTPCKRSVEVGLPAARRGGVTRARPLRRRRLAPIRPAARLGATST